MDFEGIKNFEFFISLGYVTIIASILTMIVTQIIKIMMKKRKILYEGMDSNEKDAILSKAGRIIAIVIYSFLYIGNEFYLHHRISFDGALLTGLLSGGALTLSIAKGLYTMIRQYQKKTNVFEKLKFAEDTIQKLQQQIENDDPNKVKQTEQIFDEINNPTDKKWVISNKEG